MRHRLFILTLLLTLLFGVEAEGKIRCTPIYIFGTAASFNDSIVYFTDIQILDSAWIDEKNDFLLNRGEYSTQLREHFNNTGQSGRTCIVSFALTEKDILKKYEKMRSMYTGTKKRPKRLDIRQLDDEEFKFSPVAPTGYEDKEIAQGKKSRKHVEKSKKKKDEGKLHESMRPANGTGDDTPPPMPPRH